MDDETYAEFGASIILGLVVTAITFVVLVTFFPPKTTSDADQLTVGDVKQMRQIAAEHDASLSLEEMKQIKAAAVILQQCKEAGMECKVNMSAN